MERLDIQNALETIVEHVYFQPPSKTEMKYPCIVFKITDNDTKYADNTRYISSVKTSVTLIDHDPDSPLAKEILDSFRFCSLDRTFPSGGLNHFVFTIYFL